MKRGPALAGLRSFAMQREHFRRCPVVEAFHDLSLQLLFERQYIDQTCVHGTCGPVKPGIMSFSLESMLSQEPGFFGLEAPMDYVRSMEEAVKAELHELGKKYGEQTRPLLAELIFLGRAN